MLAGLLRALRPHQWIKNLFVLAPLVFAKELFDVRTAMRALAGFGAFCLLASAVYLLNDLSDVEADRAHPVKRNRPIASGRVPVKVARATVLGLLTVAFTGGVLIHPAFALCCAAYLVLNVAYSFRLKRIAYVDVLCIAAGFELRVFAGAFAARVPASFYLLAVTFLLASFLGFGKRMHELMQNETNHKTRQVLKAYDTRTLTILLVVTAAATLSTYAVYTMDPRTRAFFGTDYLIFTTLFALVGVLRFIHLVRRRAHAESPTEEMLRDWPCLGNLGAWAIAVVVTLYLS